MLQPNLTPAVSPTDLLAEVLALRPEIDRILTDESGCHNASCIEDKVQTVLLKVAQHLDTYEPHPEGPRPWVSRIAHNVKLDARRAKRRHIAAFGYESVEPDEIEDASQCLERRARARALLCKVLPVIEGMAEPLRTVLVLVAFARLDHKQVAEELDISVGATKMRLMRARAHLREHVGSLEDHLAVLAPVPCIDPDESRSWPRRALVLTGQFVHLWPPLLLGVLALSRMEMPLFSESAPIEPSMNAVNDSILLTKVHTLAIVNPDDARPPRQTLPFTPSRDNALTAASRIRIDVTPPGKTLRWRKTR